FVLDLASWPLSRQLDRPAGALVWQMMSDLGIEILPQVQARRVLGNQWVEAVELANGQTLSADVCVVAARIPPHVVVARSAGLRVNVGVVVNEHMRTSDPLIFAAGDVAEFADRTPGLWPTATEQARVAVQNLLGNESVYSGTVPPTRLKVAGIDLLSVGEFVPCAPDGREVRVDDAGGRQSRRLVLSAGRVRGPNLMGHRDLAEPVAAAVDARVDVGDALPQRENVESSALLHARPGRA